MDSIVGHRQPLKDKLDSINLHKQRKLNSIVHHKHHAVVDHRHHMPDKLDSIINEKKNEISDTLNKIMTEKEQMKEIINEKEHEESEDKWNPIIQ